jgi:hypothetical protein
MAIVVVSGYLVALLITLIWATTSSGAAASTSPETSAAAGRVRTPSPGEHNRAAAPDYSIGSAAFVVYGERCKAARKAVVYYRALTWQRQQARYALLADLTPVVRGKTCRWARFAAEEWQARARAAGAALSRWQRSVGQVVARLDRGLSGTPMAGTGAILERWGRRYGISPYFMAAAAATESSLGAAACSNNRFNVWGLSSCGSGWHVPDWDGPKGEVPDSVGWPQAIAFYARFLADRWPGHSTPYSFTGYAACSPCWGRKVSEWMHSLFGVAAVTRYP